MAKKTSVVALVVAIFQLTFGVFGICGSVFMLGGVQEKIAELQAQQAGMQKPPITQADLFDFVEQKHPNFRTITNARGVASLVLSLMMIASGIGLLMRRPWGRILALVYAGCNIVIRIAGSLYTFTVFIPAINEFTAQFEPAGATLKAHLLAKAMRFNAIFAAVMFAGALLYPIMVLILLLLPGVGAALHGKASAEEPKDDDDRFRDD